MPRLHTEEDVAQLDVNPCKRLVAAMLRMAATDTRSHSQHRPSARQFLRNKPLVAWWLDLAGFPDTTYARLLTAAGMENDP